MKRGKGRLGQQSDDSESRQEEKEEREVRKPWVQDSAGGSNCRKEEEYYLIGVKIMTPLLEIL